MSHHEKVLCKMTPRIRIISLCTVPDTLPPMVAFVNVVWEKSSLCVHPLECQDQACVGSLFLCIRGRETTLTGHLLLAWLSVRRFFLSVSLESGHDFCFTDEGAEAQRSALV